MANDAACDRRTKLEHMTLDLALDAAAIEHLGTEDPLQADDEGPRAPKLHGNVVTPASNRRGVTRDSNAGWDRPRSRVAL
jgi:hypothetical protein